MNDKLFLIECYKINIKTINYNLFIKQFHELERNIFNKTFIEQNYDILHLIINKDNLYNYLLQNKMYNEIYKNEEINESIKIKYNILILSINDINIGNDYNDEKVKLEYINIFKGNEIIFILKKEKLFFY